MRPVVGDNCYRRKVRDPWRFSPRVLRTRGAASLCASPFIGDVVLPKVKKNVVRLCEILAWVAYMHETFSTSAVVAASSSSDGKQ